MAYVETRKTADGKTTYRAQIRRKGAPTINQTFARLTDAKKWAGTTEADIRAGRYVGDAEAQKHTLGDAVDRYVRDVLPRKRPGTSYGQGIQLAWIKERIGHLTLAEVTAPVVVELRDALTLQAPGKKPVGPATVRRYLAVLSHLLSVAVKEWGWMDDSPMRKVSKPKEPQGRIRYLSDDERAALLAACKESRSPVLHDIVLVLLCTAARRSEIENLRWPEVDFSQNQIILEGARSKSGYRRVIPLVGPAFDILKERARWRRLDTDLCFPAPPRHGQKPKPYSIQSAWDWAIARAEIKNFRMHDLRHTALSYLAMNGASTAELAGVAGHRSLAMTQRYSHISETHTGAVMARMVEKMMQPKPDAGEGAGA